MGSMSKLRARRATAKNNIVDINVDLQQWSAPLNRYPQWKLVFRLFWLRRSEKWHGRTTRPEQAIGMLREAEYG